MGEHSVKYDFNYEICVELFLGFIVMLVLKKLDRINNSLTQLTIDTKIHKTNGCAEPEDAYPVPSLQI